MNKFKIHGKSELSVENNILTIDIEGPCNLEFYNELHSKLLSMGDQLNVDNYAVILILRGESSIIQEALDFHVEFLKKTNTKAIAVVLKWCEMSSIAELMCHKAYSEANINYQFFENSHDAKNWLTNDILNSK